MNKDQDLDKRLKTMFNSIKESELKIDTFLVEPYLNQRRLKEISKEKREKRLIMVMASLAVIFLNLSIFLFIGGTISLSLWLIILMTVILGVIEFSVIVLFYSMNKFYKNNKEVIC